MGMTLEWIERVGARVRETGRLLSDFVLGQEVFNGQKLKTADNSNTHRSFATLQSPDSSFYRAFRRTEVYIVIMCGASQPTIFILWPNKNQMEISVRRFRMLLAPIRMSNSQRDKLTCDGCKTNSFAFCLHNTPSTTTTKLAVLHLDWHFHRVPALHFALTHTHTISTSTPHLIQ